MQAGLREARARLQVGDFAGVVRTLSPLVAKNARNAELLFELGRANVQLNRFDEAKRSLNQALRAAPSVGAIHLELSKCHQYEGRFEEAIGACDRALKIKPGDALSLARKGETLRAMGEREQAYELLTPLVKGGKLRTGEHEAALIFGRLCLPMKRYQEGVDALERALADDRLPRIGRSMMLYQLGALLDALGEYDRAWQAFVEANNLQKPRIDPDAYGKQTDEVIATWTREAVAKIPQAQRIDETPVFILGMPRSGTTLVEQILASHPEAHGGGELALLPRVLQNLRPKQEDGRRVDDLSLLTQGAVDRAARKYLQELKKLSREAVRITDKLPLNFLNLGHISFLFPGANVIHCKRDPLDTCLSCYFQGFGGELTLTNDLTTLGRFFRAYERRMQHWQEVLDIDILDVQYEQLVAEQESQSRRLVEFVGLEWDDACLEFYENKRVAHTASVDQVRRPVYSSSIDRWQNYEKHIGPLREAIGEQHA